MTLITLWRIFFFLVYFVEILRIVIECYIFQREFSKEKEISYITLQNNRIISLERYPLFPALQYLDVSGNSIASLKEIENLPDLQILNAQQCDISSLAPLHHCPNLRSVCLANNHIIDLSPLQNFQEFGSLTLNDNLISDLTPLSGMILHGSLSLASNHLTSFRALVQIHTLNPTIKIDVEGNPFNLLEGLTFDLFNLELLELDEPRTFLPRLPPHIADLFEEYVLIHEELMSGNNAPENDPIWEDNPLHNPQLIFDELQPPKIYKRSEILLILTKIQNCYRNSLQSLVNRLLCNESLSPNDIERIVYELPPSMRAYIEQTIPPDHTILSHPRWTRTLSLSDTQQLFC